MKLSTENQKRLAKIANKAGKSLEEIMPEFKAEVAKLEEKGSVKNIERLAINSVMNIYRKILRPKQDWMTARSNAVPIYGFIVGDAGKIDKADIMRKQVKRYINQHGISAAQDAQKINGDNEILDQRKTIFGKENPDYLSVFPPNLRILSRILYGFFRKNGTKTFKFGSLQTGDNKLARAWGKVKLNTPCQTFVNIKEETPKNFVLTSSIGQDTLTVFKKIDEDWDINSTIMKTLKNQFTKVGNITKHYEAFKGEWLRHIFVRGIVSWMNLDRPSPWGSIWVGLMDAEEGLDGEHQIRCNVSSEVSIDFGEGSEVIIFGKTRKSKYRDPETKKLVDGNVIVDVFGIYPIPGFIVPRDQPSIEASEDEDLIEGWLE